VGVTPVKETPGRKEREMQRRRQEIIDAAERVFMRNGYVNTTMEDITREAEFSRSTVYSYFTSREELFVLVHIKGLRKRRELIGKIDASLKGVDFLRAFARVYLEFYEKHPGYLQLQLYWSTFGIDVDKVSEEVKQQFYAEDGLAKKRVLKGVQEALEGSASPLAQDAERLTSYITQSLRLTMNLSLQGGYPYGKLSTKTYYDDFVDFLLLAIEGLRNEK